MSLSKFIKDVIIWLVCAIILYAVLEVFSLGYIVTYGITALLAAFVANEAYTKCKVIYKGIKTGNWKVEMYDTKVVILIMSIYSVSAGIFISDGGVLDIIIAVLLVFNALVEGYLLKKNGRLG